MPRRGWMGVLFVAQQLGQPHVVHLLAPITAVLEH